MRFSKKLISLGFIGIAITGASYMSKRRYGRMSQNMAEKSKQTIDEVNKVIKFFVESEDDKQNMDLISEFGKSRFDYMKK